MENEQYNEWCEKISCPIPDMEENGTFVLKKHGLNLNEVKEFFERFYDIKISKIEKVKQTWGRCAFHPMYEETLFYDSNKYKGQRGAFPVSYYDVEFEYK